MVQFVHWTNPEATIYIIVYVNYTPVLCDIQPEHLNTAALTMLFNFVNI